MKKYISLTMALCCLVAALTVPASAVEYTMDAPEDYLFGRPTSDDTIYIMTDAPANTDRSKTAAYIPPAFGSPTSYTLNAGELLTPNLVGQATAITSTGSGGVTIMPPAYGGAVSGGSATITGYTEVTDDLYYSGGYLGRLKIPAIGLSVKVYEGTDSTALSKGAGHFTDTSIWNGNVAIAGHNRGVNDHFGEIHTLNIGDKIEWTTKLGSRSYAVTSVAKVSVYDLSVLDSTGENTITLITCVKNQPEYRWCIRATT